MSNTAKIIIKDMDKSILEAESDGVISAYRAALYSISVLEKVRQYLEGKYFTNSYLLKAIEFDKPQKVENEA